MSKKQQQSKNKDIINYPLCSEVTFILPTNLSKVNNSIDNPSIDLTYLRHYLKALLLKKKNIQVNDVINIVFLAKQINMKVHSIVPFMEVYQQTSKIQTAKRQNNQEDHRGRQRPNRNNKRQQSSQSENDQQTQPQKLQIFSVNSNTQVVLKDSNIQIKQTRQEQLIQFYGDTSLYQQLKDSILQNFRIRKNLFDIKLGPLRGVLIGGSTGTGKTTYVKKLQSDLSSQDVFVKIISSTQLLSRVVGGAEQNVRKIFSQLSNHQVSCLIIEDMHLLFGQKQVNSNETTLVTIFNQIDYFQKPLLVIGTYNSERELSRTVYQSGHFQKQIILNLPNHKQRFEILKQILQNFCKIDEEEIKQFNLRLNGFSIGEIKQILRDAYLKNRQKIDKDILIEVLKNYRPSQIKQLIVQVPEVYWSGIGGYEDVKKQIRKVTELPLKHPDKFQLLNITPSKGVLLYGPPGCSKTMMAKAIATQSKLNFIGIKGPQLFSKYVGESQRAIRNIFRKARAFSPCIIFFDQIDALASQRTQQSDVTNRVLGQLLTQMDGVQGLKEVIIIAATNRPQILDEALTRPGRFDHLIYVGPPNLQARQKIFEISLKKTPIQGQLTQLCERMSKITENYTGAQITLICREAALEALQTNFDNPIVTGIHLQTAITKIKSRLDRQKIKRYQEFNIKFRGTLNNIPQQQNQGFKFQPTNGNKIF